MTENELLNFVKLQLTGSVSDTDFDASLITPLISAAEADIPLHTSVDFDITNGLHCQAVALKVSAWYSKNKDDDALYETLIKTIAHHSDNTVAS